MKKNDDKINIFDLLAEAERAQHTVLEMPPEVRCQLSGYEKSVLNLLTFGNIVALADWAAQHPDKWAILKLHYINPELSYGDIAHLVGVTRGIVDFCIRQKVFIESNDYWSLPE